MKFKKSTLAAAVFALLVGAPVYAETEGWGEVAGGSESSAWGAVDEPVVAQPMQAQAEPGKPACGKDDPRYASLVPVLRELQAGETIEPMQTSFGTYVTLNSNVRKILGDNLYISSPDCSEQHLFDGALTGKINVPFTDLWQVINDTLRTNDQALMNFVANNTRATPESALSVISMVQYVHLDDNQTRKLYSAIAPEKAKPTEIQKPLMLEVYLAFGGTVNESDRGKTVFVDNFSSRLHGLYIERKGGFAKPQGLQNNTNIVVDASSMLQAAGLRVQLAGRDAEKLASQ